MARADLKRKLSWHREFVTCSHKVGLKSLGAKNRHRSGMQSLCARCTWPCHFNWPERFHLLVLIYFKIKLFFKCQLKLLFVCFLYRTVKWLTSQKWQNRPETPFCDNRSVTFRHVGDMLSAGGLSLQFTVLLFFSFCFQFPVTLTILNDKIYNFLVLSVKNRILERVVSF